MIKTIPLTLLILILARSLASATSYLIEMTDGREIETSTYWTEGGEIKIEVDEGIILGIPSGEVKRIKKVQGRKHPHASEKTPEEAAPDATPPKQGKDLPSSPDHVATDEAMYQKFNAGVTAFERRVSQQFNVLKKKELFALAVEGVALKDQMLKTNQIQQLAPLILKLDKVLDLLEDRISRSP
ncbi:MAG: hypothetical protein ACREIL_02465 [Nitrospiraceae bacterium]